MTETQPNCGPIRRTHIEGVVVIEIEHPPVNALSQAVRAAVLLALHSAEEEPGVQAIVIHGAGRCFVAGADLHEFDLPPLQPLLNDVLLRLEACRKPVIAALHGAVLGGGLELALASHYRCATLDTSIAFPEIKVGLIPGSGGTQRLPRLIGVPKALEMMLGGVPVGATEALKMGLIDRLVGSTDALQGALSYAAELRAAGAGARRLRDRAVDRSDLSPRWIEEQRARVAKEPHDLFAPRAILECIEASLTQPFDAALALSRRRFEECRVSSASKALRRLFFAERAPGRWTGSAARSIRRVAVIGAGTMGTGIAISLALSGHDVILIDPKTTALLSGVERVKTTISGLITKGRLRADEAGAAIHRVTIDPELASAAGAEYVIEAVYESLAVKQEVFRALDQICGPDAVLASNTSTLDIDAIASVTGRPECVVGMHFFSPAHVSRLVEIVQGRVTGEHAMATAVSLTRRMDKLPVVVGNGFGFAGNRMLYAYGGENQRMLLEGATPSEVDAALKSFGMAMGPNAVGDLAGLDVGYSVRRERKGVVNDPHYYRVADLLVESGRLGQKSGGGAFRYAAPSREPQQDPEVERLIAAEAERLGIRRRPIPAEEIVERCTLALINEGARLLDEGIAASAADIDVIWCNGYGFPRWRGGPMYYADSMGLPQVVTSLTRYAQATGSFNWAPAPLLAELAQRGSSLATWDQEQRTTDSRLGVAQ